MGNSMRSFLGNMCGAQDSKRLANEADPDNRPLPNDAKPKEETDKEETETNDKEKSFQSCSVEATECHTPMKKKHRSGSQRRYSGLYDVDTFKPESTNLPAADQIYTKSAEKYQPFVDECSVLRKAMDSLEAVFSIDKKRIDFENAITQLNELIQKSNNDSETVNADKLTAGQQHHSAIVTSGKRVLDLIIDIQPNIGEEIEQASKLDIKESTKTPQPDGAPQLGLVSKLSVPGKHKRNLKNLRQCQTHLTTVAGETKEILTIAEKIPIASTPDADKETQQTTASSVPQESNATLLTIASSEPIEINPSKTESVQKEASKTPTDDSAHLQEEARDVPSTLSTSPLPESFPKPRVSSVSSEAINEDGRLVDYGSFWMLNPSNDEMTLIKRSRSLDSLVSRGSRSSVSRYGSYELVTNVEIQIAEKGEALRATNL